MVMFKFIVAIASGVFTGIVAAEAAKAGIDLVKAKVAIKMAEKEMKKAMEQAAPQPSQEAQAPK